MKGFSSVVQHINVYSTQFSLVTNYLGILKSFFKVFLKQGTVCKCKEIIFSFGWSFCSESDAHFHVHGF